jgi:DNA polymerase III subunit beta
MSADVLLYGISKTIFATADDELRPVMNGVFLEFSPENMTFVASDAHKLVRYKRFDVIPKLKPLYFTQETCIAVKEYTCT